MIHQQGWKYSSKEIGQPSVTIVMIPKCKQLPVVRVRTVINLDTSLYLWALWQNLGECKWTGMYKELASYRDFRVCCHKKEMYVQVVSILSHLLQVNAFREFHTKTNTYRLRLL